MKVAGHSCLTVGVAAQVGGRAGKEAPHLANMASTYFSKDKPAASPQLSQEITEKRTCIVQATRKG